MGCEFSSRDGGLGCTFRLSLRWWRPSGASTVVPRARRYGGRVVHRIVLVAIVSLVAGIAYPAEADTLIIGDSLTTSPGGYAEQMQARDPSVHVRACDGSTLSRWLSEALPLFPCNEEASAANFYDQFISPLLPIDSVVVLLGTNDALLGGNPTQFQRQIKALSLDLLEDGAGRVMLVPPPRCFIAIALVPCTPAVDLRLFLYGSSVLSECDLIPGVVCGPDRYALLDDREYFNLDGVHFSEAGHARVRDALIEALPEPDFALLRGAGLLTLLVMRRRLRAKVRTDV